MFAVSIANSNVMFSGMHLGDAEDLFSAMQQWSYGVRRAFFGVFCSSSCLHMIRRRQRWPSDIPSERSESDFAVFRSRGASFSPCRDLNDTAPYSFAHPRRCWRGHVAEYSVFCTGQDGVPQENAAVSSKYMQSVPGIMQTEKAGSMGWCIGLPSAPKRGAPPPCAVYSV